MWFMRTFDLKGVIITVIRWNDSNTGFPATGQNLCCEMMLCLRFILVWLQILQRGGGGALSLWHSQTPDLWECGALAEGAEGPRRQQHRHHAGRQQERPAPPQGRAHGWGPGLCRYTNLEGDTGRLIWNLGKHFGFFQMFDASAFSLVLL